MCIAKKEAFLIRPQRGRMAMTFVYSTNIKSLWDYKKESKINEQLYHLANIQYKPGFHYAEK